MRHQDFAAALLRQLRTDIDNFVSDAGHGRCKTIEDYRQLCGRISGLESAEQLINDLLEKAKHAGDD